MQTLIIYKLGFNENYYTFTFILLIKIVLCSKFPGTKFINYKCFDMRANSARSGASKNLFPQRFYNFTRRVFVQQLAKLGVRLRPAAGLGEAS